MYRISNFPSKTTPSTAYIKNLWKSQNTFNLKKLLLESIARSSQAQKSALNYYIISYIK